VLELAGAYERLIDCRQIVSALIGRGENSVETARRRNGFEQPLSGNEYQCENKAASRNAVLKTARFSGKSVVAIFIMRSAPRTIGRL